MVDGTDDLRASLESIAEQLADLALDRLHQAVSTPDDRERFVAEERRLTRARRAVEKAAALLDDDARRGIDEG